MSEELGARGQRDLQTAVPGRDSAMAYMMLEFDTAWRHLGGLEDKRLRLFVGYCITATLLLMFAVGLMSCLRSAEGIGDELVRTLPAVWLVMLSLAFRYIALSERQATERYRLKINLLRRTILEHAASAAVDAMQREGNDWGLQISANPSKHLRAIDILHRNRWTTALFMKLTYDGGGVLGVILVVCVWA